MIGAPGDFGRAIAYALNIRDADNYIHELEFSIRATSIAQRRFGEPYDAKAQKLDDPEMLKLRHRYADDEAVRPEPAVGEDHEPVDATA